MFKPIFITAGLLAGGIVLQSPTHAAELPVAAADAGTFTKGAAADPEAAARKFWREHIVEQSPSAQGKGCFHASYPDYVWEAVACRVPGTPSSHPTPGRVPDAEPGPQEGGATGDYVALSQGGLITHVAGTFYRVSGVPTEVNVNSSGVTTGSNDYGLQINTNWSLPTTEYNSTSLPTASPAACQGHPKCQIWQQFIYTSDFNGLSGPPGSHGELFMQYWLFNWSLQSNAGCPHGWTSSAGRNGATDCYRNGPIQSVPVVVPVSDFAKVRLSASVQQGENDELYFSYGPDAWAVIESDGFNPAHPNEDGIGIASIWQGVEFNVVGNTNSSQAKFSDGTVLGVTLNVLDSTGVSPLCLIDSDPRIGYVGTTGETNNLNLGPCSTHIVNGYGAIQFLEGTPRALELALIEAAIGGAVASGNAPPPKMLPPASEMRLDVRCGSRDATFGWRSLTASSPSAGSKIRSIVTLGDQRRNTRA